ncbi:MAG: HAD family hydrolase [bacterium]
MSPAAEKAGAAGGEKPPVAFFDRDGVLNHDRGYVHDPSAFLWIEGAREAVCLVRELGYLAVVVTNQSGVARGFYTEEQVRRLHEWINRDLAELGGRIDAFYFCPHHPEGSVTRYRGPCACRKPAPGLLERAFSETNGRPEGSFLIGDKPTDLAAAEAAGVPGFLFEGGNLLAFVREILAKKGPFTR